MAAADTPVTITGRAAVLVSKHTGFEMAAPEKTAAHEFALVNPDSVKEGVLEGWWAKDGYRHVGWAAISIQILPTKTMLNSAVEALQAEKQAVLADAQKRATDIEREIQNLLAISYDTEVQS